MANTARPVPRKGVAFRVTFPVFYSNGDMVTGATGLAATLSLDGAAFAPATNTPVEISGSGVCYLDLTAAEMNADTVAGLVTSTSPNSKATPFVLYPEELGDFRVPNATGNGALAYTWTEYQANGVTPLAGVSVWITTDQAGSNNVAGPLLTDAFGVARDISGQVFLLDPGVYWLWRQKAGWLPGASNPTQITVS